MSSKLVKNGNGIGLAVPEEVFLELKVTREGVRLQSPLPPQEVCKLLQSIAIDLIFNSFVKVEPSKIQPLM
jgi:hypothetical protein